MTARLSTFPTWALWIVLSTLTAAVASALLAIHLSAALLIGAMIAAIALAACEAPVRVPQPLYLAAQALLGVMIARTMRASLLNEVVRDWPVFTLAIGSVIVAASVLGWLLTRWRVLPGTTAVWGAFPGAATAMILMAEAYGADVRLVAFMQYLRVVIVALVATGVAHLFVVSDDGGGMGAFFPPVHGLAFVETLGLAAAAGVLGVLLRIPAGPLLVPMGAGIVVQNLGWMKIELPPALLASAYVTVGWAIGQRFTRDSLVHVAHALPRVAGAIVALIAACGLFAAALVVCAGVDPLTAYLAMSPGGADSVAIIAASSHKVDVSFVMALQMSRFIVILLVGPSLARFIADRTGPPTAPESTG